MKTAILLLIALTSLIACQSMDKNVALADMAKSKSFEYFFPGASEVRSFTTLEEANHFIGAARIKLAKSINKEATKGLAARLEGPHVEDSKPVVVVQILNAGTVSGVMDLRNSKDDLQQKLLDAITVSSVYLVFYRDRGISISDFYVASDFHYTSNAQYKAFNFRKNKYVADYPIGWDRQQAFEYLNKEMD